MKRILKFVIPVVLLFIFILPVSADGLCDSYVKSKLTEAGMTSSDNYICIYPEDNTENGSCSKYEYTIKMQNNAGDTIYVCTNKQLDVPNVDVAISNGQLTVTGLNVDNDKGWNAIFEKYKIVIQVVSGIGALTCVLAFIWEFLRLGKSAGRPEDRKRAMLGLVSTGIGAAGLGCVVLIMQIFYGFL